MKKIFTFARFTLILVLWTTFYAQMLKFLFMFKWNFNPLLLSHWDYVHKQWQEGWTIKETSEVIFLALLIAMIPIWVLGLFLCNRIKFRKKPPKKTAIETQDIPKTAQGPKRPPALIKKFKTPPRHIEQASHNHNPEKARPVPHKEPVIIDEQNNYQPQKPVVTINEAPVKPTAPTKPNMSAKAVASPKPDWDNLTKSLQDYASKKNYVTFSAMQVGSHTIDLVLFSSKIIYLICLSPDGEEWVADEASFSEEPPVWFSEYDFNVSPVFKVAKAKESLAEVLPLIMPDDYEIEAKAVVALGYGTILNSQAMIETWQTMGVEVGSFASGKANGVVAINEIIPDISLEPAISEEILNLMSLSLVSTTPDDDDD